MVCVMVDCVLLAGSVVVVDEAEEEKAERGGVPPMTNSTPLGTVQLEP